MANIKFYRSLVKDSITRVQPSIANIENAEQIVESAMSSLDGRILERVGTADDIKMI